MLGKQSTLLGQLVTSASQWRTAAATQNVTLTQINAQFPDGRAITLAWDPDQNDWLVNT